MKTRMIIRWVWGGLALIATLLGLALAAISEADLPAGELEARYAPQPSQFVVLPSGARVHFRDEGANNLPALVLIHGSFDSLYAFDGWTALLKDQYRIIRLDLPGHGLTGPVPGDDYSLSQSVRLVDDLANHLRLDRFGIVGNSMGGAVAWRYALAHPDKVSSLILIDAAAYPDNTRPLIFRIAAMPVLGDFLAKVTPRRMFELQLHQVIKNPAVITDAMIDRFHDLALRDGNRRASLIRLRQAPDSAEHALDIPKITAPTLIQWGQDDPWIPAYVGERLAKDIPGARLIIYPGAGHVPMTEIPELTARDAAAFLAVNR